jgi:hypothetical protein
MMQYRNIYLLYYFSGVLYETLLSVKKISKHYKLWNTILNFKINNIKTDLLINQAKLGYNLVI